MTHSPDLDALDRLERDAIGYFLRAANPMNGLIADSSRVGSPCSIAATGLGLAAYVVGVEQGLLHRSEAAGRTLTALRFFRGSPQGEAPDATGHRGFYYHFLDMHTGGRVWECELSMVDTSILIAGVLTSGRFFDAATDDECEIRALSAYLYERVDWLWATNHGHVVRMGWKPGSGFLSYGWEGYSEAMLLYILGLGSPTYPLPVECYQGWSDAYQWENLYDIDYLFSAPLFTHQLSHIWIDFRCIKDAFMREKRSDYFENSRRATLVQQQYAMRNPMCFSGYGEHCWGITAGLGPGFSTQRSTGGINRQYYGYVTRGVPFGPDDGTIAPWAAAASLPFAPEIVVPMLQHIRTTYPEAISGNGLLTSFNPSFFVAGGTQTGRGWIADEHQGIDQGPVALMLANYRSGLIWRLMRECPAIVTGLRRAGFNNGWLGSGSR